MLGDLLSLSQEYLALERIRLSVNFRSQFAALSHSKCLHLTLAFFKLFDLFAVFTEHFVLFVSHGAKIKRFQPLVVGIGEFLIAVLMLLLRLFYRVVSSFDVELFVTRELNCTLSIAIEDKNENLLIAQAAQLDGLFEESSLSFAECNVALVFVVDELELVNFLLAHIYFD